jgi:hypothetical protein
MPSLATSSLVKKAHQEVIAHPVYAHLDSSHNLRIFMEHHVFAVWDFMSLLKRLQGLLSVTTIPWQPPKVSRLARLINEIVLVEESDEDGRGGYSSHFELYLQAMRQCGANTTPIMTFLTALQNNRSVAAALSEAGAPAGVAQFVLSTLQVAEEGRSHEVASAFFFGREELIPSMFDKVLDAINAQGVTTERLEYYLMRHIQVDGEKHGELAREILEYLCADDILRWTEAEAQAIKSLRLRSELWQSALVAMTEVSEVMRSPLTAQADIARDPGATQS